MVSIATTQEESDFKTANEELDKFLTNMKKESSIYDKEIEIKKHRINAEYEKISRAAAMLQVAESIDLSEDDDEEYLRLSELEKKNREGTCTFLDKNVSAILPLIPMSLTFVGGITGNGKSTICANMLYTLVQEGKKCLVLANEETLVSIYDRIIFIHYGWDYNAYKGSKGFLTEEQESLKNAMALKLKKFIKVIDKSGQTTSLDGIKFALNSERAGEIKYDCIFIDYFQAVTSMLSNANATSVEVLYEFKHYLKDYIREPGTPPIVLFGQLMKLDCDNPDRDIELRTKFCKGISEACTSTVEVVKMTGMPLSRLYVDKGRWGNGGKVMSLEYDKGRLFSVDQNRVTALKMAANLEKLSGLSGNKFSMNVGEL